MLPALRSTVVKVEFEGASFLESLSSRGGGWGSVSVSVLLSLLLWLSLSLFHVRIVGARCEHGHLDDLFMGFFLTAIDTCSLSKFQRSRSSFNYDDALRGHQNEPAWSSSLQRKPGMEPPPPMMHLATVAVLPAMEGEDVGLWLATSEPRHP